MKYIAKNLEETQKIAADFVCTVLILHHINKASYGGGTNAAFAVRGESAFLDCLRLHQAQSFFLQVLQINL